MTTQSNAIPGSTQESQVLAPTAIPATRILYWSGMRISECELVELNLSD